MVDKIGSKTDPMKVGIVINKVFKKYNVDNELKSALIDCVISGVAVGSGVKEVKSALSVKKWYLENVYSSDGIKFSQKINDISRIGELTDQIKLSLKVGDAWKMAAQKLSDKGIQKGDISKDIENLLTEARQGYILANDPDGYRDYRREVERVQQKVDELINPDTSKLKRAYQDVLNLTSTASEESIAKAEKYAVYFKQRYNSERIANTEIARAYGKGKRISMLSDGDVIGVQSVLSTSHESDDFDICDMYANMNAYGMGPGIFPKDHGPDYPYHPNCHCNLIEVYIGKTKESSSDDYKPAAVEKYISGLSYDEKVNLMGVQGTKEFKRAPVSWNYQVNNFKEPSKITIENLKQAQKALYGK